MEITLYVNKSNEIETVKTLDALQYKTFSASYLKFPTDLLNPTIRITADNNDNIYKYNYAYIKEFGRYYFITNITFFNNETYDIYLNVDVMMSWWSSYKDITMLIERCEDSSYYTDEIVDFKCAFNQGVNIYNIDIPSKIDDDQFSFSHTGCNIIISLFTTADNRVSNIKRLPQTNANIPQFNNYVTGSFMNNATYIGTDLAFKEMYNLFFADTQAARSYIKYCKVLPFVVPRLWDDQTDLPYDLHQSFYVGNQAIPITLSTWQIFFPEYNIIRLKIAEFKFSETLITSMPSQWWLRNSPYSKYEIYVPYYGFVELNFNMCYNQTLKLYYFFDVSSGECVAIITRSSDNRNIWTDKVNIGVDISVDGDDSNEKNAIRQSANVGMGIKVGLGIMSTIAGIALCATPAAPAGAAAATGGATATATASTAGVGLAIGGVGSIASGVGDSIRTSMSTFNYAQTGTNENSLGNVNGLKPYLRCQYMIPQDDYNSTAYKHMNGYPCNKDMTPDEFTTQTYVKVSECLIDCGTIKEQQEIAQRLKNGVIITKPSI